MHVLITPRADRSGRGLSRTAVHQQGRQEPFGQVPDCGISAEIIPVLMRNIPSPALSLSLSPEKQAWGNPCLTPRPLTAPGWERPYPGRAHGGLPHLVPCTCPQLQGKGREDRVWDSRHGGPAPARSEPPQTRRGASSARTNLPYVSANRGNCWNQCLIGFRLWQTACRYIFLCQSRRGRRGARELGDAEWK